jgi:hypothetical protein
MMRLVNLWAVLGLACLAGCTTVSSIEPMGERPKPVLEKEWEGTWLHQDQPVLVRVSDPEQGLIEVAWVEEKQGALRLESYRIALRESGDWTFGNVRETDQPGRSYWGVLRKEPAQLVLWTPDPERCATLVKGGVIPGTVEAGGDVILERLTPGQTLRTVSGDEGGCLRWTEPVVFFRLGK